MGTIGATGGTFSTGACALVGGAIGAGIGAIPAVATAGITVTAGGLIGSGIGAALCGIPILSIVVTGMCGSAFITIAGTILTAGSFIA